MPYDITLPASIFLQNDGKTFFQIDPDAFLKTIQLGVFISVATHNLKSLVADPMFVQFKYFLEISSQTFELELDIDVT